MNIKALIKHLKRCDRFFIKKYDDIFALSDTYMLVLLNPEDAEEVLLSLRIKPEDELAVSKVGSRHKKIENGTIPNMKYFIDECKGKSIMNELIDTHLEERRFIKIRFYDSGIKFVGVNPVFAEIFDYPEIVYQEKEHGSMAVYDNDDFMGLMLPLRSKKLPSTLKELIKHRTETK